MCTRMYKVLVTGGAGFIGSMFVRKAIVNDYDVVVLDKLTYAGDTKRLEFTIPVKCYVADIVNENAVNKIIEKEQPDIIVHFAAETHVDNSLKDSKVFIETNIIGTQNLLEASRKYNVKKFIYISTDEVYGEIKEGKFTEDSPIKPNNPYSVTKASADLLVQSYIRAFNFPAIIVRPCNNYGIWQYPEKLISVVVFKAVKDQKIPVYGKGENIREWLNTEDTANAIIHLIENSNLGEIYNLGSGHEEKNIKVVKQILIMLNKPFSLIEFVQDRPGHDFRYALDSTKIKETGWKPEIDFNKGLLEAVTWYVQNFNWMEEKCLKK